MLNELNQTPAFRAQRLGSRLLLAHPCGDFGCGREGRVVDGVRESLRDRLDAGDDRWRLLHVQDRRLVVFRGGRQLQPNGVEAVVLPQNGELGTIAIEIDRPELLGVAIPKEPHPAGAVGRLLGRHEVLDRAIALPVRQICKTQQGRFGHYGGVAVVVPHPGAEALVSRSRKANGDFCHRTIPLPLHSRSYSTGLEVRIA